MNPNIPAKCNGCGAPLLLENLFCDDGCPCNTPRGVNFKPQSCAVCRVDDCAKPGHRLAELFGEPPASIEDGRLTAFLKAERDHLDERE